MTKTVRPKEKKKSAYFRLLSEVGEYRKDALLSPLCTIGCVVLEILIPWPGSVSRLTLLGLEAPMRFTRTAEGALVQIPEILRGTSPLALAMRIEK